MNQILKKISIITITITLLVSVSACDKKEEQKANKNTPGATTESTGSTVSEETPVDEDTLKQLVVSVGKEKVYYSEAMVYFKYIQAQYESLFGNQIWGYEIEGQSFGDKAKQEIINMIAQTKIAGAQAEKYGIEVTDEDESVIQENAETFLSNLTAKDKNQYGITLDIAKKFYKDNLIYEKVYDASTMNVDTDVSDEEAKQITVDWLLIKTTETDGKGKEQPMSEEDKEKAHKKAKELLKKAKKAENFNTFAQANTQDSKVQYTLGKGDMDPELENTAFKLKTGQLSGIVETVNGYYILKCISDFNEDATLAKKEEIIAGRQDKAFKDIYKDWAKGFKININEKVWNMMVFTNSSNDEDATEETDSQK